MINLLPPDQKQSLHYARRNAILSKWLIGLLVTLMLVIVTVLSGSIYLKSESRRYAHITEDTRQELKDQHLEEAQGKIENISAKLKLIAQVLSRQVIFSGLIKQIGAVMPERAVLSDIEISKVEGGIDLTANAKDYTTATQVQVNLTDPNNKLFDKADIVSVNCNGSDPEYPCVVVVRALFAKNNPYMFINQNTAKVTP